MDQEKTYKWVQDRLRELNAGTIAEADFHQLETLAKDDPFVADALEGYQSHPDLNHSEYLDSLTQKIKPYKRERRRWLIPNLTVTAVAASLILIVGFYAVMTRLSTKHDEGLANATSAEHALSIEKSGDTVAIVPDQENTIASAEPSQPVAAAEVPRPETMRKSVTKPSSVKADKKEVAASETTRSKPADETYAIEDTKTKGVSPPYGKDSGQTKMNDQTATPALATEKQAAAYYANQIDPAVQAQRVTGRVTSLHGEPLIGVHLLIPGTNLGAVSQLDGKFELYLPDGASPVDVVYGGYENTQINLKPGDEDVNVQLNELSATTLNEVLPGNASGATSAKNASPKMSTVTVQMDDNLLFVDYLKTNSKYPLADIVNSSVKIVNLEFVVNADGHPSQIKVTQSSGENNLDDEAVRLIRKGPDWECAASQYPCKVKYSIYFKG